MEAIECCSSQVFKLVIELSVSITRHWLAHVQAKSLYTVNSLRVPNLDHRHITP